MALKNSDLNQKGFFRKWMPNVDLNFISNKFHGMG